MTKPQKNPLCVFEDIIPHYREVFPVKDKADFLAKSRQGNAPQYWRTGTQRSSPALFRKKDVLAFAIRRWGDLRPDLIRGMLDAGFEPEPALSATPKKKIRKVRS